MPLVDSRPKEFNLNKPGPNPHFSRFSLRALASLAALALIGGLVISATATAQNPAADQYAPTSPSGGGAVPTNPSGGGAVPTNPAGDSGKPVQVSAPDDGAAPAAADVSGAVSTAPTDTARTAAPVASTQATDASRPNDDRQTLDGIAASAKQQRDEAAAANGSQSPGTALLRSDSADGTGVGVFLWAVLSATALWAAATVLRRRRDQDGHPA